MLLNVVGALGAAELKLDFLLSCVTSSISVSASIGRSLVPERESEEPVLVEEVPVPVPLPILETPVPLPILEIEIGQGAWASLSLHDVVWRCC